MSSPVPYKKSQINATRISGSRSPSQKKTIVISDYSSSDEDTLGLSQSSKRQSQQTIIKKKYDTEDNFSQKDQESLSQVTPLHSTLNSQSIPVSTQTKKYVPKQAMTCVQEQYIDLFKALDILDCTIVPSWITSKNPIYSDISDHHESLINSN